MFYVTVGESCYWTYSTGNFLDFFRALAYISYKNKTQFKVKDLLSGFIEDKNHVRLISNEKLVIDMN